VVLRVAHSSRRTTLMCRGEGIEPRLEFSRSHVHFGAVVPYFAVEEEVSICNPCNFPIELYSLEFDQMHLEDEKVITCPRLLAQQYVVDPKVAAKYFFARLQECRSLSSLSELFRDA